MRWDTQEQRVARFWLKCDRCGPDECWPWIAAKYDNGYGVVHYEGKNTGAHRAAWAITHGPIPPGMNVLHRCDNKPCVNPAHLFLGTQKANIDDAITKGRLFKIKPQRTRLTPADIDAIRLAPTGRIAGQKFGICKGYAEHIRRGYTPKELQ